MSGESEPMMTDPATPQASTSTGAASSKRPATSDLTQPADKKSKTVTPTDRKVVHRGSVDASFSNAPSNFIRLVPALLHEPSIITEPVFITVRTANLESYFGSLWHSLTTGLYPDSSFKPANIISEDDFKIVCRYFTKSRVDTVYANASGRRPADRIPVSRDFQLPKALADLINGIGTITIAGGLVTVIPGPEPAPEDASLKLSHLASFSKLKKFTTLITSCTSRGLIRSGYLSSTTEGTAWWLLTAKQADGITATTEEHVNTSVYAHFKEFTPHDVYQAAIAINGFDGVIPPYLPKPMLTSDVIRNLPGIRQIYNIEA